MDNVQLQSFISKPSWLTFKSYLHGMKFGHQKTIQRFWMNTNNHSLLACAVLFATFQVSQV
jgi:hypothetical protein